MVGLHTNPMIAAQNPSVRVHPRQHGMSAWTHLANREGCCHLRVDATRSSKAGTVRGLPWGDLECREVRKRG